jgi:hypothetical protein
MSDRFKEIIITSGLYDCILDPYDKHNTGDPYGSLIDDLEKVGQLTTQECIDNLFFHGYDDAANQLVWLRDSLFRGE